MMAQSQPSGIYTLDQVMAIARRAKRYPASVTASELRVLALHVLTREVEES